MIELKNPIMVKQGMCEEVALILEQLIAKYEPTKDLRTWPIIVLPNKIAGDGKIEKCPQISDIIKRELNPTACYPESLDQYLFLLDNLAPKKVIIAPAGGDGTHGHAINILSHANREGRLQAILAPIAIGRGNALGHYLRISELEKYLPIRIPIEKQIKKNCDMIKNGEIVRFNAIHNVTEDNYCLFAGSGFDSRLAKHAEKRKEEWGSKKILGHEFHWSEFGYFIAALDTFRSFEEHKIEEIILEEGIDTRGYFDKKIYYPKQRIITKRGKREERTIYSRLEDNLMISLSIIPNTGFGFPIFPKASPFSGYIKFDLLNCKLKEAPAKIPALMRGVKHLPGTHRVKAKHVIIRYKKARFHRNGCLYEHPENREMVFEIAQGPNVLVPKDFYNKHRKEIKNPNSSKLRGIF